MLTPSRTYPLLVTLGAFLLFHIQPMIARVLLPLFGGTAAVWTACITFFQVSLVAGYFYAERLARLPSIRTQIGLHLALLSVSLLMLPLDFPRETGPNFADSPIRNLFMYLILALGLPYTLLAATTPLVQAWHAATYPRLTPYRLFAFSNAGSLAALLSYPLMTEPLFSLKQQLILWTSLYVIFFCLCAMTSLGILRSTPAPIFHRSPPVPVGLSPGRAALLVAFSACAVGLLLSTTNHLSQNIAPFPLLWIIPLALYLLSFILCFAREGRYYVRRVYFGLLIPSVGALIFLTYVAMGFEGPMLLIVVSCSSLFVCCMVCHGELYRLRPPPGALTQYYLVISVGGALGGIIVSVVAPLIFGGYYELNISILLCTLLAAWSWLSDHPYSVSPRRWVLSAALVVTAALFLGHNIWMYQAIQRVSVRNFYGALSVSDTQIGDPSRAERLLHHGAVLHGSQFLSAPRRRQPTTYYGPGSGAATAIHVARSGNQPVRAGIIGLGVGTIAAYGQPGDVFRFYEINPLVEDLARTEFSFLSDSAAQCAVILGDGRLSLQREADQRFDVLVIDAFSGDSIPVHLLTTEAFELYFRHTGTTGIVAFHISNWHLELEQVIGAAARRFGKTVFLSLSGENPETGQRTTKWALVLDPGAPAARDDRVRSLPPLQADPSAQPWTDEYSNVLSVLRLFSGTSAPPAARLR